MWRNEEPDNRRKRKERERNRRRLEMQAGKPTFSFADFMSCRKVPK